jgi:hypothetical protein
MLGVEAADKCCEALSLDATDGQHQCLYPRRRDGQEGIERHDRPAVIPPLCFSSDEFDNSSATQAFWTCRGGLGPWLNRTHPASETAVFPLRSSTSQLDSTVRRRQLWKYRRSTRGLRSNLRAAISHEIVDVASSSRCLLSGFVSGQRQWSHKQGRPGLSNGVVRDWPAAAPPFWRRPWDWPGKGVPMIKPLLTSNPSLVETNGKFLDSISINYRIVSAMHIHTTHAYPSK